MRFPGRVLSLIVALGAACLAKTVVGPVPEVGVPAEPLRIPLKLGAWEGREVHLEEDEPDLAEIDIDWRLLREYRRGNACVQLLVEYNRPGNALEHTPDHCVRGRGWLWTSSEDAVVRVPGWRQPLPVTATVMENEGTKAGLVYWYQLGNRPFANHVRRKLVAIGRVLLLRPPEPKVGVRLIASKPGASDAALITMAKEFAGLVAPHCRLAYHHRGDVVQHPGPSTQQASQPGAA
jgi:EpsI family protein